MRRRQLKRTKKSSPLHHRVYVIELQDCDGPGTVGYYVGMTGLPLEERFRRHKAGIQDSPVVRRYGVRLAPEYYEHIRPMTYRDALKKEALWAEELRANGLTVYGGH